MNVLTSNPQQLLNWGFDVPRLGSYLIVNIKSVIDGNTKLVHEWDLGVLVVKAE